MKIEKLNNLKYNINNQKINYKFVNNMMLNLLKMIINYQNSKFKNYNVK